MSEEKKNFGMMTRALHSGWKNDPATGASGLPIYITSAYQFKSTDHAARLFSLSEEGHIYSDFPTRQYLPLKRGLIHLKAEAAVSLFLPGSLRLHI
jgi:O-acetylhomoserine/O-acetylserine sulfhydrylase-like pyridoxal-dependent enzyme